MEDIRKKKCNPIVDLLKFTSNKKLLSGIVTLVYITRLQSNLFPNFVQSLIMLGLKKFRVVTKFF